MRIYTYKQLYKPGKAITSVRKKKEGNINFITLISANAFKSNKFFDLKSEKKFVKLVIQKLILLKTFVIILRNIDNHQSIYINFSIFFCTLQIKAVTFWDLTTSKCVISLYTYIHVKLRDITAQEVPFLEIPISRFCDRHVFFT